jgi:hypothetical protein
MVHKHIHAALPQSHYAAHPIDPSAAFHICVKSFLDFFLAKHITFANEHFMIHTEPSHKMQQFWRTDTKCSHVVGQNVLLFGVCQKQSLIVGELTVHAASQNGLPHTAGLSYHGYSIPNCFCLALSLL